LQIAIRIEVVCYRRQLVAFAAVDAFVGRDQVSEQVMRDKGASSSFYAV